MAGGRAWPHRFFISVKPMRGGGADYTHYITTCPPDFQNSYGPVAAKSGTYCGHQTIRGPGFYNCEVTRSILLISLLPLVQIDLNSEGFDLPRHICQREGV